MGGSAEELVARAQELKEGKERGVYERPLDPYPSAPKDPAERRAWMDRRNEALQARSRG